LEMLRMTNGRRLGYQSVFHDLDRNPRIPLCAILRLGGRSLARVIPTLSRPLERGPRPLLE